MKKTTARKLAITAGIFTASFTMYSCFNNIIASVYGPPEDKTYSDYDPEINFNENVYGPPAEEYDASVSEAPEQDESDLTDLEIAEMQAVDEAISNLMNSDEYKSLDTEEERREAAIALINTLAESGTEEYPYPLIDKSSVSAEGDVISFSYKCGVFGGVMTEPFDPMMN